MSFATLLKKRKKDEWLLTPFVPTEDGGMTLGETLYHGCGTPRILELILECHSRLGSLPSVSEDGVDERHLAFGYKSADALISHAHEMIIGEGEMGVTGTIRCGGQSSRVLLNFMFMGLDLSSQEPTIRDMMNDWMWRDLANTFDYAGTYTKVPFIASSK